MVVNCLFPNSVGGALDAQLAAEDCCKLLVLQDLVTSMWSSNSSNMPHGSFTVDRGKTHVYLQETFTFDPGRHFCTKVDSATGE